MPPLLRYPVLANSEPRPRSFRTPGVSRYTTRISDFRRSSLFENRRCISSFDSRCLTRSTVLFSPVRQPISIVRTLGKYPAKAIFPEMGRLPRSSTSNGKRALGSFRFFYCSGVSIIHSFLHVQNRTGDAGRFFEGLQRS